MKKILLLNSNYLSIQQLSNNPLDNFKEWLGNDYFVIICEFPVEEIIKVVEI